MGCEGESAYQCLSVAEWHGDVTCGVIRGRYVRPERPGAAGCTRLPASPTSPTSHRQTFSAIRYFPQEQLQIDIIFVTEKVNVKPRLGSFYICFCFIWRISVTKIIKHTELLLVPILKVELFHIISKKNDFMLLNIVEGTQHGRNQECEGPVFSGWPSWVVLREVASDGPDEQTWEFMSSGQTAQPVTHILIPYIPWPHACWICFQKMPC